VRLDLRVDLKTVDLVRETAWTALTERLGWGGVLTGLERSVLWRFEGNAGLAGALERELERTSSYYNPNKERRAFLETGLLGDGEPLGSGDTLPAGTAKPGSPWRALLWVTDEGGERPDLVRSSGARLARDGARLDSLHSGTLWEIELRAGSRNEARGLVAGLAIARSRREGLLLNPHYQEGHLLAMNPVEESQAR